MLFRSVRKLQDFLSPSEEEYKEFRIKQSGEEFVEEDGSTSIVAEGQTRWNKKGLEELEIEIGEKATDIIIEALEKIDKEKKLTAQHMSVYEKFVKNKD